MKVLASIALVLALSHLSSPVLAQDREQPTRLIERPSEGFKLTIPPSWALEEDPAYALLAISPDGPKACSVRRTADWSFEVMTIDEYYAGLTDEQILSLVSMGYTDPKVHMKQMVDFAQGAGVHFVYSGSLNGHRIVTVIFQTIAQGSIYTLNCITNAGRIDFDYKQFLDIADTFKLITD